MDPITNPKKIHPLAATAAVAVILVSLTGVAAMTGILPNFNKTPAPEVAATPDPADLKAEVAASQAAVTEPPSRSVEEKYSDSPRGNASRKMAPTAGNVASYAGPDSPQRDSRRDSQRDAQRDSSYSSPSPASAPVCVSCGVVESVRAIEQKAPASGLGAAAGAVLGGVLGHQVGGGNGRTLATIAGAVGGGFAGNAVEKNVHTSTTYEVLVRMENGNLQRFVMDTQRWRSGDPVRVEGGNLVARN